MNASLNTYQRKVFELFFSTFLVPFKLSHCALMLLFTAMILAVMLGTINIQNFVSSKGVFGGTSIEEFV